MRVLHCCLASFYIDGFGYQENVLPRGHRLLGHDVKIVASTENYSGGTERTYVEASSYLSEEGIPITRLAYVKWLPAWLARKARIYSGLSGELRRFRPDVIFLHDLQFLSIWTIRNYAKRHRVAVYVDSHTDFINSARTVVSKYILHGILYRFCAWLIEPVTSVFYPTLPARAHFMASMYGIKLSRMRLLPFGVDDLDGALIIDRTERNQRRSNLGIGINDIVLITGGKIDSRKNILELLRALPVIRSKTNSAVKLVVFGVPDSECEVDFRVLIDQPGVIYRGWLNPSQITQLMCLADLAVFPGTHSVLWEQAVGLGLPCVFRKWRGIDHVDIGGNCVFLESGDENSISSVVLSVLNDQNLWVGMRLAASGPKHLQFRYSEIARYSIESDMASLADEHMR